MSRQRNHGWLPTTGQQVAGTAMQAKIAYKVARRLAAQGVDPTLAARHAANVSNCVMGYWGVYPLASFIGLVLGPQGFPLLLWALGTWAFTAVLYVRLRDFQNAVPPAIPTYEFSSPSLAALSLLWIIAGFPVAVMATLFLAVAP